MEKEDWEKKLDILKKCKDDFIEGYRSSKSSKSVKRAFGNQKYKSAMVIAENLLKNNPELFSLHYGDTIDAVQTEEFSRIKKETKFIQTLNEILETLEEKINSFDEEE